MPPPPGAQGVSAYRAVGQRLAGLLAEERAGGDEEEEEDDEGGGARRADPNGAAEAKPRASATRSKKRLLKYQLSLVVLLLPFVLQLS